MNEKEMLLIYKTIRKIITNPNRRQRGLVRELIDTTYLEVEDILQELYCQFIEKHRDKEIEHLPTYLDRFCFTALMNMKRYYDQEKRAEGRFQEQYNEQFCYSNCDQEEIIIEIINKKS